jgi:hypothetical protein
MNNTIHRVVTLGAAYAPLSVVPIRFTGTITFPPRKADGAAQSGNQAFTAGDTGQDVPWEPGEYIEVVGIELAALQAKGTAGDQLVLKGGTW